jgi:hypothetical protein
MAIDKRSRDQPLVSSLLSSTRTVIKPRLCFKMYDKNNYHQQRQYQHQHDGSAMNPTSPYFPPILKRSRSKYSKGNTMPFKLITSKVNLPPPESNYYSDSSCSSSSSPSTSPYPEKTLKIIMPYESNHSVRFHSKVSVVRIPSREHYPEAMKRTMWSSMQEISINARRNTLEFSSEGWDWRTATEEQDMYIHPETGDYVHPVHVKKRSTSRRTTTSTQQKDELIMEEEEQLQDEQPEKGCA